MDTLYVLPWKPSFAYDLGAFREWLANREELKTEDGKPVWWHLIVQQGWACLEELLAVNAEIQDTLLNWKDQRSRGWVWMCLAFNVPSKIFLKGLDKLLPGWDTLDTLGNDPLVMAREGQSIQGIARKLWSQNPLNFNNRIRHLVEQSLTLSAQRAWLFWANGVH